MVAAALTWAFMATCVAAVGWGMALRRAYEIELLHSAVSALQEQLMTAKNARSAAVCEATRANGVCAAQRTVIAAMRETRKG